MAFAFLAMLWDGTLLLGWFFRAEPFGLIDLVALIAWFRLIYNDWQPRQVGPSQIRSRHEVVGFLAAFVLIVWRLYGFHLGSGYFQGQ